MLFWTHKLHYYASVFNFTWILKESSYNISLKIKLQFFLNKIKNAFKVRFPILGTLSVIGKFIYWKHNLKTFYYADHYHNRIEMQAVKYSIAFNACACREKHGKQIVKRACRSNLELLAVVTSILAIFVLALKMISNDFERVANARYNIRTTNEIINHWHPWNVFDCRRLVGKPRHEKVRDPLTIKYAVGTRMKNGNSDERQWEKAEWRECYKRKPREKTRSRWRRISSRSYGISPRWQYAQGIYKLSRTVKIYSVTCPRTSSRLEPVARKMNRPGWVVP